MVNKISNYTHQYCENANEKKCQEVGNIQQSNKTHNKCQYLLKTHTKEGINEQHDGIKQQ